MPAASSRVGEPGDERRLGADDDEVDALGPGQRDEAVEVVDADRQQPRVGGDARVAGRAQQLGRAAASAAARGRSRARARPRRRPGPSVTWRALGRYSEAVEM